MAYYNTCARCGCSLDPGERCDCASEEKRRDEFYEKVVRVNQKTGQFAFCMDSREVSYEKKAVC